MGKANGAQNGGQRRKRVCVIGAGAAGMSCAESLAQHPDRFEVTLIEPNGFCGGQAFSIPIDEKRYGGSHIYHHTFYHFKQNGHEATPVQLSVSFGKDHSFWTNVFPTELLEKHKKEIARFNTAIKTMHYLGVMFALIPIKHSLKLWRFSDDFINFMIYPSLALFLGTGNATPELPTILMERLYTSPTYGMWYPIDKKSLSSVLPPMVVFPPLSDFYGQWQKRLEDRGVKVRLYTEVVEILERSKKGVKLTTRKRRETEDGHVKDDQDEDQPTTLEEYDEIVLCCLADKAQQLLGKTARWIDRKVLGSTKWADDLTCTHNDGEYMKSHFTPLYDDKNARSEIAGRDDSHRVEAGKEKFSPMYLIRQCDDDPEKLEMCFDCSNFQAQLLDKREFKDHTIYLDNRQKHLWSRDKIDKSKIIREDWWHQLRHEWTHYVCVVPWMWLLNGKKSTHYAASWTLVNAHEVAVISGMAAAYKLGAAYELEEDGWARLCFRCYLFLSHMSFYRRGKNRKDE